VSADPRYALRRPREVGAIVGDAFALYRRHFWIFAVIGAVVVVPVNLIVIGLGLEQLFSGYDPTPPVEHQLIELAAAFLLMLPLVTAMTTYALLELDAGKLRGPGGPIMSGLEAFTPLFFSVVLAAAGIVLGLFVFILPGIYVLVRWYFVPQAVVVDGRRSVEALSRSGELVRGYWWRTLGIVLLANVAAIVPASLVQLPFVAGADAADSSGIALAGQIIAMTITWPFTAIAVTLLYFDLRARTEGVSPPSPPPPVPEPPRDLDRPEAPLPPR
jgi:hypothetical protein